MSEFVFETRVELPVNVVFAFHENPANLLLLHEEGEVRLLHHTGQIRPGAQTWVEYSLAGIVPVVMGFLHEQYEPPRRFSERMLHGPFARFVHTHEFESAGKATVVRDRLDVALPWYYGGDLTMHCVGSRLRELFAQRGRRLQQIGGN